MKQHHKQKRERITRNISTWDKRMSGKVQNYFQSYRLQCSCHSQESCASLATKRQYHPVPCSTFLSAVWMQCNTLCLIQLPSKGCGGEELPLQRADICYPTFLPNMYTRPENSQVHPSHLWIDEDVQVPCQQLIWQTPQVGDQALDIWKRQEEKRPFQVFGIWLTNQSWNTKISVGREKHRHLFPILQESSPSTPNRIQITSNHYWVSKGVPSSFPQSREIDQNLDTAMSLEPGSWPLMENKNLQPQA